MPPLPYECVICTRNRLSALRLSIPMLLAQTRRPERVIVVDASDDHEAVRAGVEALCANAPCEVLVIESPAGSTTQRNRGLELVNAPVVLFPDDDSLCDPDYAETILDIYERDEDGQIGCVIGSPRLDADATPDPAALARMRWSDRLRQMTVTRRMKIERAVVLDPLIGIGDEHVARWQEPSWLAEIEGELNCWVTGFRMSFRTSAIRDAGGFDETLRGYATCEDLSAGFSVAREKLIFQSRHARVFHHQMPGGRGSGRLRGATNIANRVYVTARHSDPGSVHRRRAAKYAAYRCLLYCAGAVWSGYHRDSLRGALAVLRRLRPLLKAPADRAAGEYRALMAAAGATFD